MSKSKLPAPYLVCSAVLSLCLTAGVAFAEGNCPAGYYPIGGQGVQGCAPINGGGGSVGDSAPRPAVRWQKTWGAQSSSTNGIAYSVTGKSSKSEAERDAVRGCRQLGGIGCEAMFTYKNQCYAVARVGGGKGDYFARAGSIRRARAVATEGCRTQGGTDCEILNAECTEPRFIKY